MYYDFHVTAFSARCGLLLQRSRIQWCLCFSVCRSVSHTAELCKHCCNDRDATWGAHCLGPKEPCSGWMSTLLLSLPGEYHRSICGAAVMWLVLSLLWPLVFTTMGGRWQILNTNTNWLAISTTSHIVGCELVKNLKYTKGGGNWHIRPVSGEILEAQSVLGTVEDIRFNKIRRYLMRC